jgi:adhesin/invasin
MSRCIPALCRSSLFAFSFLILLIVPWHGFAQTPLTESDGAEVSASGFTGICLLCSISNVDNLVSDDLTTVTNISMTAGVLTSGYACVDLNRTIPGGRTAGFAAQLNGGLAGLLSNTTLRTYLDGQLQESMSGSATLISVGAVLDDNVAAQFSQPFDEICFRGAALADVAAVYSLRYGFVMESSPQHSTITSEPAEITANGTATARITVQAMDDTGEPIVAGGDSLQLMTTAGSLSSSITDHGDGIYTTWLTAADTEGTAVVSGLLNGQPMDDTATVAFVSDSGGPADPQTTRFTAQPTLVPADGVAASVITVEARDAWGNPLTAGGDAVTLDASEGTLSIVTDHGDGTYSAELRSATIGTATVSGTINGDDIADSVNVDFVTSVAADASQSTMQADPDMLPADGSSVSVITVQAADANGDPLGSGGDSVALETTLGTLAATVTDHGDGSYSTTLIAPTTAGVADISGTLNGDPIGMTTQVTFFSDFADPEFTTLTAHPGDITANGTAQAVITVEARDGADVPIGSGGDDVQIWSTAGSLSSSVVDKGDGTYTALLTASTTEETATISGAINGEMIFQTATVEFVSDAGGPADPGTTRITAQPTVIAADGLDASIVTVEARDAWGNPLTSGGDDVTLDASEGSLSTVTDHGDGTYSAELTSIATGTATVTGTINGDDINDWVVVEFVTSVEADASQSTMEANPDLLPADGSAVSVITVQAADANGDPLSSGGDSVALETTLGTLAATVTDHGDGSYSTTLTAPTTAGVAEVSGTLNGEPIGMTVEVTFYDPNIADPGQTSISAYPGSITANGISQSVIHVEAHNAGGDPVGSGGDTIVLNTSAGTIGSSVTDHGDGTYTALLTSSTTIETATVTGTINGEVISDAAGVHFVADEGGPADPLATRVSANPTVILADGTATSTITVEARDAWGNPIGVGGSIVTIATNAGGISGVEDHEDGTYTAELTASTTPGTATITATIDGQDIAESAQVQFTGTVEVDAEQSYITADPDSLPADGSSTAIVTVQAVYDNGDPMTSGGHTVTLYTTAGTLATTVIDHGDGSYTTTLTAPNHTALAEITGTIDGMPIGGAAQVLIGEDGIFSDRFEADD